MTIIKTLLSGVKEILKRKAAGGIPSSLLIGYSALDLFEDCYEYNENACYIADSPEALKKFLDGAMLPVKNYRIKAVKMSDILNDFGCSGGEYALESKALDRFKSTTKTSNIKYSIEPYEDILGDQEPDLFVVDIDIPPRGHKYPDVPGENYNIEEEKDAQLRSILRELEFHNRTFPREALASAIANRDRIIPYLLEIIEQAAQNIEYLGKEQNYMAHMYAMYLLAQFREKTAYPLIVDFFSIPGEIATNVTGDVVTQDLGRILASVSGRDISFIKSLIEKEDVGEYVRTAGLKALVTLVASGQIERDEVMIYFRELFRKKLDRDYSGVWDGLVARSADLYPEEVYEDIKQAYEDDLVSTGYINMDDVQNAVNRGKDSVLDALQHNSYYTLIEDAIWEMESWACFDESESFWRKEQPQQSEQVHVTTKKQEKIGRNAPCPCGSGKKYKKCCLNKSH